MDGLLADKATAPSFDERDGKMLTENADVAHSTSGEPLVDLFYELEGVVGGDRLRHVLEKAWATDAESTLKIIWNARSIHLGKSSRNVFYQAVGWLYTNHPATLIINLPWLVRPLIPKKAPQQEQKGEEKGEAKQEAKDVDSDFEMIDEKELPGQPETKKIKLDEDAALSEFDVKYGVAHGYWKDLLNILALAANDELKFDGQPRTILNVEKPKGKPRDRDWTEGRKKAITQARHDKIVNKLKTDPIYKALHVSVARLFADQLKLDFDRLQSSAKQDVKAITLCGKWAPTHKAMHDQHTCIVTSIAELLFSFEDVCPDADPGDRTLYIKHLRQRYHFTIPKLRKHLQIVERSITAEKFDEIKYNRVPSLAMKQYTPLFAKKDFDRFDKYIEDVAQGKATISGATLLPSTLVRDVLGGPRMTHGRGSVTTTQLVEKKMHDIKLKSLGGQWSTLVQRIKDSGTLESSIAIADVSGSMHSPVFPDSTRPIDSSVGLALLIAEVTKPPFGGAFITFSDQPQVMRVGGDSDKRSFKEKVDYIERSNWSMNTNFVSVFEDLILPMAIENKLTQEDMVKQVFVFSDMQFDGCGGGQRWTTSFERIQKKYKDAGYEMPQIVFWNLAGGRNGTAPKPVTATEEGTALVSGYSQGQLKMFLENGQFEDPEEEDVIGQTEDGDEVVIEKKTEKKKQDPLAQVKRAISHDAYRMLKVVD
ncbi:hypothetical protein M409DRAFT_64689 [Zasmidium cellare ATCC 36951]|uniref:DUF2828 domain-containing protein n=1 Tax=Zasmidium cellare ATCC 36951 TaxID=1080233 RepID=A0A6A6CRA2_ZASCE|nr:uncharacterized protein M409DRAFT_64689 [Zasmidium cellare ATCC 36951]KAF2169611.1 hypothetical protein M409DRAFT_64689 [Zasmidium cellare ATCC 36951]